MKWIESNKLSLANIILSSVKKTILNRDLAYQMRKKLGDWIKVLQLLKTSSGAKKIADPEEILESDLLAAQSGAGTDIQLEEAYNEIGEYYCERQRWDVAIKYYMLGRNLAKQMECYYILEDYESLIKVLDQLTENSELLPVGFNNKKI